MAPRAGRPAERVLVRARKGSRAPLTLLAPFVLHDAPGCAGGAVYTRAAQAVLGGEADATIGNG